MPALFFKQLLNIYDDLPMALAPTTPVLPG